LNSIANSGVRLAHGACDEVGEFGALRPEQMDRVGKPLVRQGHIAAIDQQ
jgi:hypothetical protein